MSDSVSLRKAHKDPRWSNIAPLIGQYGKSLTPDPPAPTRIVEYQGIGAYAQASWSTRTLSAPVPTFTKDIGQLIFGVWEERAWHIHRVRYRPGPEIIRDVVLPFLPP